MVHGPSLMAGGLAGAGAGAAASKGRVASGRHAWGGCRGPEYNSATILFHGYHAVAAGTNRTTSKCTLLFQHTRRPVQNVNYPVVGHGLIC